MEFQQAFQKLSTINQSHILKHWESLNNVQKNCLIGQIEHLNIPLLQQQQNMLITPSQQTKSFSPFVDFSLSGNDADRMLGQELISQGLMGCLIAAGGQGSRLRFEGPKGMFPITPIRHKSLFQLFADKVLAASKQVKRPLPVAIMTSLQNHQATVDYFEHHRFFGLSPEQLSFFTQENLPFLDPHENLFLEETFKIAEGPDGNGTALHHFFHSGTWRKWHDQGIKYLNFIIIDNPLADPFDAELLGYHQRVQDEITVKCAIRRGIAENVGVLAKDDGKVIVVEYSEMPEEERTALNADGSLRYQCANLSLFCFNMEFIHRIAIDENSQTPLHKAFKAVKYLTPFGKSLLSHEPNAWKFEKFIFDLLPLSNKVNALLYPRDECFAPLKNYSGIDSVATVQDSLQKRDKKILSSITGTPPPEGTIEISQDFYYPTPELIAKWRGKRIPQSGYIGSFAP